MAQALTRVTKKYGNLVMYYVDDVVIATPTIDLVLPCGELLSAFFRLRKLPLALHTTILIGSMRSLDA